MADIRELTIGNLLEMAELFVSVFSKEPWNEEWDADMAKERLDIFLTNRYPVALGYYDNDVLVGFVLGNYSPYLKSMSFFLQEMCVATDQQGKGVGKKLFDSLEEHLNVLGVVDLGLLTLKGTPAEQFYLKRGVKSQSNVPLMYKRINI